MTTSVASGKLERSWALVKASLADYRKDWLPYVKILAVVSVPFNLVAIFDFQPADVQSFSTYGFFASIFMNVALLWSILEHNRGHKPTMPQAYYTGVGQVVSYVLTTLLLVLMLVPLALGITIYSAAAAPDQGTTPGEVLLVGVVALVIALPSFYLAARYGLSMLLVMRDKLRPIAALRRARQLTLGRFWPVTGRLLILVLLVLVLCVPAGLVTMGLSLLHQDAWGVALFQIITTFTVLPITYIFGLKLLDNLDELPAPVKRKKAAKTDDLPEPDTKPNPKPEPKKI